MIITNKPCSLFHLAQNSLKVESMLPKFECIELANESIICKKCLPGRFFCSRFFKKERFLLFSKTPHTITLLEKGMSTFKMNLTSKQISVKQYSLRRKKNLQRKFYLKSIEKIAVANENKSNSV